MSLSALSTNQNWGRMRLCSSPISSFASIFPGCNLPYWTYWPSCREDRGCTSWNTAALAFLNRQNCDEAGSWATQGLGRTTG